MPEIEYAFLADAAEVQPGSKFYVLGGGITRLLLCFTEGVGLTAVDRSAFSRSTAWRKLMPWTFITQSMGPPPDGAEVANATGRVVSHGPADASDVVLTIAVDLWNMTLNVAGEHAVRITVDGSERKRLPLTVTRVQQASGPEPPRYLA